MTQFILRIKWFYKKNRAYTNFVRSWESVVAEEEREDKWKEIATKLRTVKKKVQEADPGDLSLRQQGK